MQRSGGKRDYGNLREPWYSAERLSYVIGNSMLQRAWGKKSHGSPTETERVEPCLPSWQLGNEHMTRPDQWDVPAQDFDL